MPTKTYPNNSALFNVKIPTSQNINIQPIWEEYFETHSEQCRNILLEKYLYLVKYTAERIWMRLPSKIELDDLIQAGIFGLNDAIAGFDPGRGVKFESYCSARIRGSILDELRNMDWVPRLVRVRSNQLETAKQTLLAQLGRMPNETELADELEVDKLEFNRLQRDANTIGLVSLNNKFTAFDDDSDISDVEIIENPKSSDPFEKSQRQDVKDLFTKGLTRAERLVLILYYYEEMTMKEIGITLDLSESRVSQMHSALLVRLKEQMHSQIGELVETV